MVQQVLRGNELESKGIPDGSLDGGCSLILASVVGFLNRVRECFVDENMQAYLALLPTSVSRTACRDNRNRCSRSHVRKIKPTSETSEDYCEVQGYDVLARR